MFETGKTAQASTEMRRYNIAVLGLCETRWTQSGQIRLSTRETLLYSGHEEDNSPHTEGVGLMLSAEATASLIEWTPVSSRIVLARFRSRTRNVQIVQCYAPTNHADGDVKTDFYEQLQTTLEQRTKRDILIVMGDFNAKIGSDNVGREHVMGREGQINETIVIGGSLFRHKQIHKAAWISPDHHTEN